MKCWRRTLRALVSSFCSFMVARPLPTLGRISLAHNGIALMVLYPYSSSGRPFYKFYKVNSVLSIRLFSEGIPSFLITRFSSFYFILFFYTSCIIFVTSSLTSFFTSALCTVEDNTIPSTKSFFYPNISLKGKFKVKKKLPFFVKSNLIFTTVLRRNSSL